MPRNNKEDFKVCLQYFFFQLPSDLIETKNWIQNTILIRTYYAGVLVTVNHKMIPIHHGLYGCTSCCISHGPSQWEMAIFDPSQLRQPSTDFHETLNI